MKAYARIIAVYWINLEVKLLAYRRSWFFLSTVNPVSHCEQNKKKKTTASCDQLCHIFQKPMNQNSGLKGS